MDNLKILEDLCVQNMYIRTLIQNDAIMIKSKPNERDPKWNFPIKLLRCISSTGNHAASVSSNKSVELIQKQYI